MTSIGKVASAINDLATKHPFGRFQELRKQVQGKKTTRSVIFDISKPSVNEDEGWAFHTGGREELQFNIGFEKEENRFRFGVAFSLETSRSLPSIDPLLPKIERFNEFVRLNSTTLEGFRMWVWRRRSIIKRDTAVRQITDDEIETPTFIFLGKAVPPSHIDISEILDCFEQLLALYCFVETSSAEASQLVAVPGDLAFSFEQRLTLGDSETSRNGNQDKINVALRSNQIKRRLCEQLKCRSDIKLGDELPSGNGGRIDLVCLLPSGEYDFYEIKPAVLARHAIREALPQLLEYAYRRGGKEPRRLIVASQAPLDDISSEFLASLRAKGLPIHYEQVSIS
ncbi:hypothetical protein [Edaphobacter bradus]|uniref:hypothetical protein n=1 Tax=Edaphobacter bradus TaxID=2259016 RepID=UPI0021DFE98E|nr:hypothetical protein [Edaphobacter bradus]